MNKKYYYQDEDEDDDERGDATTPPYKPADTELYWTSDMVLAATLMLIGHLKDVVVEDNSGKCTFGFVNNEVISERARKFFKGEVEVEPQAFHMQLRALRTRINHVLNAKK